MINFSRGLHGQAVFPTNKEQPLACAFSPVTIGQTSAGWATQPWPGTDSWPVAAQLPTALLAQASCIASDGQGWLESPWPGRGDYPYLFSTKGLYGQYSMQWAQTPIPAQVTQYLYQTQTNLGSNYTRFCERPYCSSGVYESLGWMFKPLYTQVIFGIKASNATNAQVLLPTFVKLKLFSQYYIEFDGETIKPPTQIYCSTVPLFFTDNALHAQCIVEEKKTLSCQWKKRPF